MLESSNTLVSHHIIYVISLNGTTIGIQKGLELVKAILTI